jgi:site-specific DNA-methyltransferase (adenine-specific)
MSVFYKGDVFNILKSQIKEKSVNLIYINPPFGTTQNFWDEKIDWKKLFIEMFRVIKDDGMIVIHCSIPFNYELIRAAPKKPSHSWYWYKDCAPTFCLGTNYQPLRIVEEILVWKNKKATYYRQQIGTETKTVSRGVMNGTYYGKTTAETYTITGKTRTHFINMKRDIQGFSTRPKELCELMINSYSKEGDTILDLFCYKGLTYRCKGNRRWIGIDKYFMPNLAY